MPFQLRVHRVDYTPAEITITGHVTNGAYAGPEVVLLRGSDGRTVTTAVTSHGVHGAVEWPVPAGSPAILTLRVPPPQGGDPFRLDESQPVIGRGTIILNSSREDITAELQSPMFWATYLGYHMTGDEFEEPHETFWGVSQEALNAYYTTTFSARQDAGVWPYMRLPAGRNTYVELEFAAGIEYQDRFWIDDESIGERVLLGYHSGHFSLPAFRPTEALALATATDPEHAAATVLWLTGAYFAEDDDPDVDVIARYIAALPGLRPGAAHAAAGALIEHSRVPDIAWRHDDTLGWVNNSMYSQRNPTGPMSTLQPPDFSSSAASSSPPARHDGVPCKHNARPARALRPTRGRRATRLTTIRKNLPRFHPENAARCAHVTTGAQHAPQG